MENQKDRAELFKKKTDFDFDGDSSINRRLSEVNELRNTNRNKKKR